ncbi:hypothetical protein M378DRAFT_172518 [Amanita muscaria Koide BX008]|uniref:Uncharacterized protein n=1 Tax=Amanita muscaria (strain Koide BX008) TaxID=946122 RepID=A0A0C2WIZ6_AMAMK|nr:hypothetical protein M378DRAFT_172518 [Amanita muscaria Koide BX008]
MASSVAIPQDIINNIIEAVGDDSLLLKNCALVSSSFLLPSRKRLFSQIYLRNDQACQRLYQFLAEDPVIQSFVRSIAITYRTSKSHLQLNRTSLIAILRLTFCCLESLSIDIKIGMHPSNWNDFSSELKDALSTIIHSPTLKTLYLTEVSVPIMLFHGIHLTKLVLHSLLFNDLDGEQSSLLTSATSEGVATTIDQCVWTFDTVPQPTEPIFLPFMSRLRVLEIRVDPSSATMDDFDILSFLMRSLRVSLTSPATLEHLKFYIVFEGDDNHFNFYEFFDDLRDAHVWRHLDSIITRPAGSRLQRVDINIEYSFREDDNVGEPDKALVMEPVLDALPLLRKKAMEWMASVREREVKGKAVSEEARWSLIARERPFKRDTILCPEVIRRNRRCKGKIKLNEMHDVAKHQE